MSANAADKHLESAWEKARQLPDYRKYQLIDFVEFLATREARRHGLIEEEREELDIHLSGDEKATVAGEQINAEVAEDRGRCASDMAE